MVRTAATSPFALVFAATAVLTAGCFDTSSTLTTLDYPTLLTVDPSRFRGKLSCGAPGLARYVVTLFNALEEVTCGDPVCPPSPVTTSGPVPCSRQVSFGEPTMRSGQFYRAIIEGYDRDDLEQREPVFIDGVWNPGSRNMYVPSTDVIVPPTWTTTCGEIPPLLPGDAEADAAGDASPYNLLREPTLVASKQEVFLHGCVPFTEASTPDASVDDGSAPPDGASHDADAASQDAVSPPDGASEDVEPPRDAVLDADAADGGAPDADGGAEGGR